MATENLEFIVTEKGLREVVRNLEGLAKTAEVSGDKVDRLKAALAGVNGQGVVAPQRIAKGLENVGTSAIHAGNSIYFLQRALAVIAGTLALDRLIGYADTWAGIKTRVDLATRSMAESAVVQEKLFDIAQKTGTPLGDIVDLYSRARRGADDLNASQSQLIKFTGGVAKALALQNTKSTQAGGALLQLGQLMSGAKVQSQEWNSLIDQTPMILAVAARGFTETGMTVGQLGQMVKKQQIPVKDFFEAFLRGSETLDVEMNKVFPTFSRGATVISNALVRYIGQVNEASGVSAAFGKVAGFLAENIDLIGASLVSVGTLLAIVLSPAVAQTLAATFKALFVASWPATLIGALSAAIIWISLVGSKIELVTGQAATLKDVFTVLSNEIGGFFSEVWRSVTNVINGFSEWIATSENGVAVFIDSARNIVSEALSAVYKYIDNGSEGMWWFVTASIKIAYAIVAAYTAAVDTVSRLFEALVNNVANPFNRIHNMIASVEDGYNRLLAKGKAVLTGTEFKAPALVPRKTVLSEKDDFDIGKYYADSFSKGLKEAGPKAEKDSAAFMDKVILAGKLRLEEEANKKTGTVDLESALGKPRLPEVDDKAAKKLQKERERYLKQLESSYESLRQKLAPLEHLQAEYAEGVVTLNDAQKEGLITEEKKGILLGRLAEYYKDLLDPFGKVIADIRTETELLKLSADERSIATEIRKQEIEAMKRFNPLTEQQITLLRESLTLQQEQAKLSSAKDSLRTGSQGVADQDFSRMLKGSMELEQTDPNYTRIDTLKALESQYSQLFEGTSAGLQLQLSQYETYYSRINEMEQNSIISAQDAAQMKAKVDAMAYETRTQNVKTFYDDLATLSTSENRKLAIIGKAAAVTSATIDGYAAVQKAFASAPPPANYALAAAATVAAAANVARVSGVPIGFRTGGEFTIGGSGGPDSQVVSFRGSPGEKVSVATPEQVRRGNPGNSSFNQESKMPDIKMINVMDPNVVGDYLGTKDGEKVVMNIIRRNKSVLRTL